MVAKVGSKPRPAPKPVSQSTSKQVSTQQTNKQQVREARRAARKKMRELAAKDQFGKIATGDWQDEISLTARHPLRARMDPMSAPRGLRAEFRHRLQQRFDKIDGVADTKQAFSHLKQQFGIDPSMLRRRPARQLPQVQAQAPQASTAMQAADAPKVAKGISSNTEAQAPANATANQKAALTAGQHQAAAAPRAATAQGGQATQSTQAAQGAQAAQAAQATSGADTTPSTDYNNVNVNLPQPPNDPNFVAEPWRTCEALPHIAGESAMAKPQDVVAGHKPGEAFMRWDEETVNQQCAFGKQTGAVNDDIVKDSNQAAKSLLGFEKGQPVEGSAKQIAAEDFAKTLAERVPGERLAPTQVAGALQYINGATDAKQQANRIAKSLQSFQTLDKAGTPPVTRKQMVEELWAKDGMNVPGHSLEKFSNAELKEKYDQINGLRYVPGEHKVKLGSDRSYNMKVDDNGQLGSQNVKKKSFWSKVGDFAKKAAGVVLTAASFIPGPIGVAARVGNALYNAYQGAKNGRWGQAIAGVAGAVGGVAGGIAGKAAGTVARVANGVSRIAGGIQAGMDAYKNRNAGGILGAIAGVASGVAGTVSNGASNFANTMNNVAKWAGRGSQALYTADAVKRGDYLGAASMATGLAAASTNNPNLANKLGTASQVFYGASALERGLKDKDWMAVASGGTNIASALTQNQDVDNAAQVTEATDFFRQALKTGDESFIHQAGMRLGETVHNVARDTYERHFNKPEVQALEPAVQAQLEAEAGAEASASGEGTGVEATAEAGAGAAAEAPAEAVAVRSDGVPIDANGEPVAMPAADYQIKAGDNLSKIAQEAFGDASRWPEIYEANKHILGDDPNAIPAGATITIPGGDVQLSQARRNELFNQAAQGNNAGLDPVTGQALPEAATIDPITGQRVLQGAFTPAPVDVNSFGHDLANSFDGAIGDVRGLEKWAKTTLGAMGLKDKADDIFKQVVTRFNGDPRAVFSTIKNWSKRLKFGGMGVGGVADFLNSEYETAAGKFSQAGAGGLLGYGVSKVLGKANPWVAAASLAEGALPQEYRTLSGTLQGTGSLIGATVESILTQSSDPFTRWDKQNLSGEHAWIYREAGEASRFWGKHGVVGGLSLFWDSITNW